MAKQVDLRRSESKGMGSPRDEELDEEEPGPQSTPLDVPLLRGAYNQTYVIRKPAAAAGAGGGARAREVLFRCGKWCYSGSIELPVPEVTLRNVPVVIPSLQRQQGGLKYICEAVDIPNTSVYRAPLDEFYDIADFLAVEIGSDATTELITRWADVFKWLDNNDATYFELQTKPVPALSSVEMIASKTFTRGLILVMIYLENSIYVTLQDGEGSQPLLDVRFPDVSRNGHGLHIRSYAEEPYQKLTIWEAVPGDVVNSANRQGGQGQGQAQASAQQQQQASQQQRPQRTFKSLAGTNYVQTYVVMEREAGSTDPARDALFRFGSWCYGGTVALGEHRIGLQHTPIVIQALRLQQSSLKFVFDVAKVPDSSRFLAPLEHMQDLCVRIQAEVLRCTDVLERDVARGSRRDLQSWLEDDDAVSFFEFETGGHDVFEGVELIATKVYTAGIVLVVMYFEGTFYVVLQDGENEQPLLDSRFPDVSSKGRGYQFNTYVDGIEGWPELRRIALWQTVPRPVAVAGAESGSDVEETAEADVDDDDDFGAQAKLTSSAASTATATRKASKGEVKPADDEPASAKPQVDEEGDSVPARASSAAPGDAADAKSGAKLETSNSVRKVVATPKVAMPHHVAPLRGIVPHSALQGGLGPAPWDSTGRPLGSRPLGSPDAGAGAKGLGALGPLGGAKGEGLSSKGFK